VFLRPKKQKTHKSRGKRADNSKVWKLALSWHRSVCMGFQSCLFYTTISWLPGRLMGCGASVSLSGSLLSFIQLIGLPVSFTVPYFAGKLYSQWSLVFFLSLFGIFGYTGLLIGNSYLVMMISVISIGMYIGGIFPLALTLFGLRARDAKESAALSGMAQSIGY